MKSILNLIVHGFSSLLSVFKKTENTSGVGLIDSTGNGAQNEHSRINWTYIIILLLVGVGCYLIPSPFQRYASPSIENNSHTTRATLGIPDTNYIFLPPITGKDTTGSTTYVAVLDPIIIRAMPDIVELEVVVGGSSTDPIQGLIRASSIPYIERDTLKIDQYIEYNLEPKPIQQIARIDSIFTIDSVWITMPRPWIEEPAVVASGISIFWILLGVIFI